MVEISRRNPSAGAKSCFSRSNPANKAPLKRSPLLGGRTRAGLVRPSFFDCPDNPSAAFEPQSRKFHKPTLQDGITIVEGSIVDSRPGRKDAVRKAIA